jgi:hypothetical protein
MVDSCVEYHGEKNSRRTYLVVRIASISGIPKCSLMEGVRIAPQADVEDE